MRMIACLSIIVSASLFLSYAEKPESTSDIVNNTILNRRSIRKYKDQKVPKEILDVIVKAGINAPSAINKQPWEIRVVSKPELLKKIKATGANFYNALVVIVVANDTANSYSELDCGLLSQNIMLSAESFKLGTCALGNLARAISKNTPEADSVLAELKFSKGYKPVLGIALGYKDESPDAKPRDPSKVKFID